MYSITGRGLELAAVCLIHPLPLITSERSERRVVSQLRICRPPPPSLKSGHLDIKDAQCAETKDVLKKSYRDFELWAFKKRLVHSKIKFLVAQNVPFGRPQRPNAMWCDIKFYAQIYFQHIAHLLCQDGHFWGGGVCISLVGNNLYSEWHAKVLTHCKL